MKIRLSLLVLLIGMSAACGRFEGTFRFLRSEPKNELVPGAFVLDRNSYSEAMLRSMRYGDLSARVVLKHDGTFSISRMPDCWLTAWSDPKGGYDGCSGSWSLSKRDSVYAVSLRVEQWSEDSAYARENGNRLILYTGAFILTKEKDGYGLALALAAGDRGFIYFRRENEANKAPEPTPTSVMPRAGARVTPAAVVAHL